MKKATAYLLSTFFVFVSVIGWTPSVAQDTTEVTLRGVAEPPFLGEGIPANVMLLIDNSASMYDMAYDDIEEPGLCNDDSYIPQGTIQQDIWSATDSYPAGSFVAVRHWNTDDEEWGKKWYKAGTAMTGGDEPDGSGSWSAAEWDSAAAYVRGDIVVIQKKIVQYDENGTVTDVSYIYDWYMAVAPAVADTDPQTTTGVWKRIPSMYGGYFDNDQWYQWSDADQMFVMIAEPASSVAACTAYSGSASPAHERVWNDDLCQVIQPYGFSHILIDFAAKGNYLNWVVSSKLDVEKKVLTGGKSDPSQSFLINESRGCQERRMLRQVKVDDDDNDANGFQYLLMAVSPGEESSSGNGTDLASCKALCTSANVATCTSDCDSDCGAQCPSDLTCLANCDNSKATCDGNSTACYNGCQTTYYACMAAAQNSNQEDACLNKNNTSGLEPCQWDCDNFWYCNTDYAVCTTGCGSDAACVTTCESQCESDCIDQCESKCDVDWAGTGLDVEISRIEFFAPVEVLFDPISPECEAALAASAFGQVKNLSEVCLGATGQQNESFAFSNAAFNHGFQTCWGYPTVGNGDITRMINACANIYETGVHPTDITSSDSGYVCMGGVGDPTVISDDIGYVGRCFEGWVLSGQGNCVYTTCNSSADVTAPDSCVGGYVYSCPTDYAWDDSLNTCLDNSTGTPDPLIQSPQVLQYTGNCNIQWLANHDDNLDDDNLPPAKTLDGCVEWAIRDYCGAWYDPPAPDAERPVSSVTDDHFPNLPAILIDVAINTQLDNPIKSVPAFVQINSSPSGLLQNVTGNLRIGAMIFNRRGTKWEMDNSSDLSVTDRENFYGCASGTGCDNKDGSIVIDYITNNSDSSGLVQSINQIKATSWTPMAEAMYNAIGYYTRDKRLTVSDFYKKTDTAATWQAGIDYSLGALVKNGTGDVFWAVTEGESAGDSSNLAGGTDTGVVQWELLKEAGDPDSVLDPVQAHCQSNNILVLTDGASTGDWNNVVRTFAATISNGDTDITDQCGRFYGSTYVDDMAYYGQSGTSIYPEEQYVDLYGADATKNNIQTYIVTTGALQVNGTEDECRADVLLKETAEQGGTDRFYPGEDVNQLQEQLTLIFNDLRSRASAGSAASVISSSRGGEGAIYQAIFWPEQKEYDAFGNEYSVSWIGDVHSLFIDDQGFMYEDTNGNSVMNPWDDTNTDGNCSENGTEGDCRVIVYYNGNETRACRNTTIYTTGTCTGLNQDINLKNVKFLWSAAEQLSAIPDGIIGENRTYSDFTNQRYIFTWNDLTNDGAVDSKEVFAFTVAEDLTAEVVSGGRGSVTHDFDAVNKVEVDEIINWIRGEDQTGMRSREYSFGKTWRLGDVIHSTPMVVAAPAEAYNLLYHDLSYAEFSGKWKNRRQMIYFGGNDGMLHAVNGGFYDEANKAFTLGFDDKGTSTPVDDVYTANGPALGNERWAYVPYNLLPHLKSLTQMDYADNHKYFVDMRPRIFDAQIFDPADADHPYGWGTILVGGMRFGGAPVPATELPLPEEGTVTKNPVGDDRVFSSSYFVLDITNPEIPPTLLGETTLTTTAGATTDMGFSTVNPTLGIMKNVPDDNLYGATRSDWYLILGSGPHGVDALKGVSDQNGKVAVIPLKTSNGTTNGTDLYSAANMRIPDSLPTDTLGGRYLLDNDSFASDMVTIDFDINPSTISYMSDAVYFGTVSGDFHLTNGKWDGGGKLYRLVTRDITNYGVGSVQGVSTPDSWMLKPLIDAQRPITAAPNVGYDDQDNFWVYFGTGRFFDARDKTDDTQQKFYGIKEPMDVVNATTRQFNWLEVSENYAANTPGSKGLTNVSEIIVMEETPAARDLYCLDNDNVSVTDANGNPLPQLDTGDINNTDCLPVTPSASVITTFSDLDSYIAGKDKFDVNECSVADNDNTNCSDGWYKNFWPYNNRERNLGQSTLLGGLLLFTTYQPYNDVCRAEGLAYLYGVYYKTGTAWTKSVFGDFDADGGTSTDRYNLDKYSLGVGLATTPNLHTGSGGDGNPKAFVQTSTGEIKEIEQEVSPIKPYDTGRSKWKVYERPASCP